MNCCKSHSCLCDKTVALRMYRSSYELLGKFFLGSPAQCLALGWVSTQCSLWGMMLRVRNLMTVLEGGPELTNAWGLWSFGIGWNLTPILSTPAMFSWLVLECICFFTLFMLEKLLSTTAVGNGQMRRMLARSRKLGQSFATLLKMDETLQFLHVLLS